MDCKRALEETNGDFEAAIDYLRKKGQKVSAKRADREAREGVVIAKTNEAGTVGYIIHVTSETDFVAKNEDFIQFAEEVAAIAVAKDVKSAEELYAQPMGDGTVKDRFDTEVGRIGEKIEIGSFERVRGETVVPYIHAGYKIGVLVSLNQSGNGQISDIGKDVAMQIAAMNPIAVDESSVDEATQQRELEIGKEQARAEGKPDNIIDKIAQGKLQKFFKENTLVHQQFVKDSSKKVADVLKEVDPGLEVTEFKRVALG